MNLNEILSGEKNLTAKELLQELNKQSKAELENSLLKECLMEYTTQYEKLKKELENTAEQVAKRSEDTAAQVVKQSAENNATAKDMTRSNELLVKYLNKKLETWTTELVCKIEYAANIIEANNAKAENLYRDYKNEIYGLHKGTDSRFLWLFLFNGLIGAIVVIILLLLVYWFTK